MVDNKSFIISKLLGVQTRATDHYPKEILMRSRQRHDDLTSTLKSKFLLCTYIGTL